MVDILSIGSGAVNAYRQAWSTPSNKFSILLGVDQDYLCK